MPLRDLFPTAAGKVSLNRRLLRRLVASQEQSAQALEHISATLEAIGRLMAASAGRPWESIRRPEQPAEDRSSIGSPDDRYFADLEAIQDDYLQRFGRDVDDEELIRIYTDHRESQGRGDEAG